MAPTCERPQALGMAASGDDDASTTSRSARARDYDGTPGTDLIRGGLVIGSSTGLSKPPFNK